MEAVSNTSPLVFAARIPGLLPLLQRQFNRVWVPQPVVKEAVDAALGSEQAAVRESARQVQNLLGNELFAIVPAAPPLEGLPQKLGPGESAALALALHRSLKWVLVDERSATSIARRMGLAPLPVSMLPLIGAREGWIEVVEARELLQELLAHHYHLSSRIYLQLVRRLESLA